MKDFSGRVVQWANPFSCFPVTSFIRTRDNKRKREVSKVPWKENQWDSLPSVRPWPLTPPLPDNPQQQTKHQSQSIYFKLPYEIRCQIYELVLGAEQGSKVGKVLHIFGKSGRLHHVRCYHIDGISGGQGTERNGWQHDCWNPWRFRPYGLGRHKNLLALPKTCRRMYAESLPLIYSVNTFSFRVDTAVLHLPLNIRPSYLNQIRSVTCDFAQEFDKYPLLPPSHTPTCPTTSPVPPDNLTWSRAIHLLSTLQSLRSLKITISRSSYRMPDSTSLDDFPTIWQLQQALEPFREVRQCLEFEIMLLWTVPKELREVLGETPFVLHDGGYLWHGGYLRLRDWASSEMFDDGFAGTL